MKSLPMPGQVSATQIIMRMQDGDSFPNAFARVIIRAHLAPQIADAAVKYAKEQGYINLPEDK